MGKNGQKTAFFARFYPFFVRKGALLPENLVENEVSFCR